MNGSLKHCAADTVKKFELPYLTLSHWMFIWSETHEQKQVCFEQEVYLFIQSQQHVKG
jgi:hypothetical protein